MSIKTKKFSQLSAASDGKLILANDNKLYQSTSSLSELVQNVDNLASKELVQETSATITGMIPSTAGLATETDLQTVSGALSNYEQKITYGYDENKSITAINNSAIGGTGGASYIAGQGIKIENDTISINANECSVGEYAFAEGSWTNAKGQYSHAEGNGTSAKKIASHAEGELTLADAEGSHAEGKNTSALGYASHAEGTYSIAYSSCSHAEGSNTKAKGKYSHAEGEWTSAIGENSHAEGYYTIAGSDYMHVGGKYNATTANALFVLGNGNYSINKRSDAFIIYPDGSVSAAGKISANGVELGAGGGGEVDYVPLSATKIMIGSNNTSGNVENNFFIQGTNNTGAGSLFIQGTNNSGRMVCLIQGTSNTANSYSLAVGYQNSADTRSVAIGQTNSAYSESTTLGRNNLAKWSSLTVGDGNYANTNSFSLGQLNNSAKEQSIAIGSNNSATIDSLAVGSNLKTNNCSLAQGGENSAVKYSLAQGQFCTANNASIAQGYNNSAIEHSQAFGYYTSATNGGMAIGTYNKTTTAAFVIGNGQNYQGTVTLSDSFIINKNGSVSAAGNITAAGKTLIGAADINLGVSSNVVTSISGKTVRLGDMEVAKLELNGSNEITGYNGTAFAGGGGGASYNAGQGINISNNTISINSKDCTVDGDFAWAEGSATTARGVGSHAEGVGTSAGWDIYTTAAHAEGSGCSAKNSYSHAEGELTLASGQHSHAEGYKTSAMADDSFAGGYFTQAKYRHEFVIGRNNVINKPTEIGNDSPYFVIGNGGPYSDSNKSNAFMVTSGGLVSACGDVRIPNISLSALYNAFTALSSEFATYKANHS